MSPSHEQLLFENHDLRQRLSIVQEQLIIALREKSGSDDPQPDPNGFRSLQNRIAELEKLCERQHLRIEELAEWGVELESELDAQKAEAEKVWDWAEPQLALLDASKPEVAARYPSVSPAARGDSETHDEPNSIATETQAQRE